MGVDDNVIDITKYLDRSQAESDIGADASGSRGSFAVWGGEGDRSRFALPLWRSIYLVDGGRGGLVWEDLDGAPGVLTPFFVLDLGAEPARTEFGYDLVEGLETSEAPTVLEGPSGLGIFLGSREGRQWFMVLDERGTEDPVQGGDREDLLFLAGECAGLLFFKGLGQDED